MTNREKYFSNMNPYDLLCRMNANLRTGHNMNTTPCIISAFRREYVWERDVRCEKFNADCEKCLQAWLNEEALTMWSKYCKHYKEGDCIRFKAGCEYIECGDCEDYETKPFTAEQKKKPVTNGDKIRQMTDEQLATIVGRCLFCIYYHEPDCSAYDCYEGKLAYMKKEADEDAGSKAD